MEFDVLIDGTSCNSMGILCVKRPDFPAPQKRYNELEILGKDGKLYQDTGLYDDVDIPIEFNYMDQVQNWGERWREAKSFFLGAKTLKFSDDSSVFWKVKKVYLSDNLRNSNRIGRFSVNFVLDPYTYLESGNGLYTAAQITENIYELAKPDYLIEGEGVCTLTVNGNEMTANVGQNLTIDTYREVSYRTDSGANNNIAVSGDYEGLFLPTGSVEISITSGFELKIRPNWRCV